MPSLLEAIDNKYDDAENTCGSTDEVQFVIFVPKSDHQKKRLKRVLTLDNCGVNSAGEESALKNALADLEELDLAHNQLNNLEDIWRILRCSPRLTFLNLSFNNLDSTAAPQVNEPKFSNPDLSSLSTLILIETNVSWEVVHCLLSCAANLKELHMSKNHFSVIETSHSELSDGAIYPQVTKLVFNENPIESWDEVKKIGALFPNLVHLGLSDCKISSIPENAPRDFLNLESISLSNNPLNEIDDVVQLNLFEKLADVRIQGTTIFPDLTAHERRQMFVALLPSVQRLNGGTAISADERDVSERAFIRYFMDKSEPRPNRYHDLIAIHGELQRLADVQLKPQTRVTVRFVLDELAVERQITVYQTVRELKVFLEPIFGIRPNCLKLYYCDATEGCGAEVMRYPDKQLFSYNICDGDEIHLHAKTS